jgi:hypothetical protein
MPRAGHPAAHQIVANQNAERLITFVNADITEINNPGNQTGLRARTNAEWIVPASAA